MEDKRQYRSPRREAQAHETRRRVIAAATAEFAEHGYAATTIAGVAGRATVSIKTVEALFGRKAELLKAAIDVAIAGDDEPVAMLHRAWARAAHDAPDLEGMLVAAAGQLQRSMRRSAHLVNAAFEAAPTDPELRILADQLAANRRVVARWLVDRIVQRAPLRPGLTRAAAVDTVWLLMEPAGYLRMVTYRHWSSTRYARWFAETTRRALTPDHA